MDLRKDRWSEYVEELCCKSGKPAENFKLEDGSNVRNDQKRPDIISDEIYAAINDMKSEEWYCHRYWWHTSWVLKMLEGNALKMLVELCMKVYNRGVWPDDFTKTVIIPIPRKANVVECANYRTINLISHSSKILLKILNNRLQSKSRYAYW